MIRSWAAGSQAPSIDESDFQSVLRQAAERKNLQPQQGFAEVQRQIRHAVEVGILEDV